MFLRDRSGLDRGGQEVTESRLHKNAIVTIVTINRRTPEHRADHASLELATGERRPFVGMLKPIIRDGPTGFGIDNRQIGIGPDLNQSLARRQMPQFRRRGRGYVGDVLPGETARAPRK